MLRRFRLLAASIVGALDIIAPLAPLAAAPEPLPPAAILRELKSFRTMGTVLHIGAHPDDENTELITWLSLGRGYRTGYLSITRGDGGQNELGPELGEKLGVARTQELLAARRLDGGRQFFTRAIDFGFSKTPEETLRFWDSNQVLSDVVRIIRQFRPDVIITRFPVPPGSGGHGHHTASAILAVEAFKLAGDPKAFPEQLAQGLTIWQPKRVLWNSFRFGNAPQALNGPTFQTDIAGTDAVTGESFGAIAARSRAMHKTQGLGGFTSRVGSGPNPQTFMLLAGDPAEKDLMDGIDTTWARYPGGAEIDRLVSDALTEAAKTESPSIQTLLTIRRKLASFPVDPLLADKRAQLDRIITSWLALHLETTAPVSEVVPGESVHLTFSAQANRLEMGVPVRYLGIRTPFAQRALDIPLLVPGKTASGTLDVPLPVGLSLTQPYWLREEGSAGVAHVSDPTLIGKPENPPALPVTHVLGIGDQEFEIADEPVNIVRDEQGEHRRRLDVIPPVSLAFNSEVFVVPPGTSKDVTVEVTAARAGAGTLRLEAPTGWKVAPASQDFHFANTGDQARFSFKVTAPAEPTAGHFTASAEIGGKRYSNQRYEIRYSHIPVQLLQPPARVRVASFPLETRGFTIGYVPGAGDSVAECMEQMGYVVHRLAGVDLTPERLKGLDAVVFGVRAFDERDDLKAALPGLFAWVEAGGTVIAQYNRSDRPLKAGELGPYELSIKGPASLLRVTDENAPVTFLAPDNSSLNAPNKITAADFAGWVQERGTYFPSKWDEAHYTSILAMNDPGEAPLKSSLLIARHGKGYYVYTGLTFFRQLPAGVPGAYRLFANLISLGK